MGNHLYHIIYSESSSPHIICEETKIFVWLSVYSIDIEHWHVGGVDQSTAAAILFETDILLIWLYGLISVHIGLMEEVGSQFSCVKVYSILLECQL